METTHEKPQTSPPHDPTTPPNASINRVRIVDLPGLPLVDGVRYAQIHAEAALTG
ncbi:MAG: hypothetical protein GVY30_07045 [Chloroflexi bacterium]|nr:hypothetical protein [Chloroflexota bacterium]